MKKPAKDCIRIGTAFARTGVALTLIACAVMLGIGGHKSADPMQSTVTIDTKVAVKVDPLMALLMGMSRRTFGIGPAVASSQVSIVQSYACSGFVVEGELVTAAHCFGEKNAKVIKITVTRPTGEQFEAHIAAVADRDDSDIAELAAPEVAKIPSLSLATRTPQRGDELTQIGSPAHILFVVSKGLLVGFDQRRGWNVATLDTYGGNSGGVVLNRSGQVIGMCHAVLEGSRFTGIGTLQALRNFVHSNDTR